jgi:hypothetical protein
MGFAGQQPLEDALDTLGALLEARDLQYSLVAVGGGSLLLLGLLQRPTKDLDIVAHDWVNAGPASLLDFGLPEGFETRLQARRFGGLDLRLLGRSDQVALKLYAAVDQGPSSKHAADLRQLAASRSELLAGARWARQHDPSPGFRASLVQALAAFDVRGDDDDL